MNKFNKRIANPASPSTSHARKFYYILSGKRVRTHITKGELNELINGYTQGQIAVARGKYKATRLASPYKRAMLEELGVRNAYVFTGDATRMLRQFKVDKPEEYRAAKAKLRGFRMRKKLENLI